MSLEDNVRRQMEEAANAQSRGECPVDGEVDAAFSRTVSSFRKAGRKAAVARATGKKPDYSYMARGQYGPAVKGKEGRARTKQARANSKEMRGGK